MSKQAFDCSLPDPAPSAAGVETEDDDYATPDGDDSSPDEHDQPPSKTSKGNGQAPAAKQRGPNCTREWKLQPITGRTRSAPKSQELGFMGWWCALRIAATRTPESSCKIACATSWLISVRARLLTQAGLVMVVREYQGQVAAAQWRVLSCCQQPKLAVGAQLHQRRPTDKSIGLIVKE